MTSDDTSTLEPMPERPELDTSKSPTSFPNRRA